MLKIKEYEQSEMILYTMYELVPKESLGYDIKEVGID